MLLGELDLRDRWRLPLHLSAVLSIFFLGLLAVVATWRLGAFVEFDWVEGATVSTIRRVLTGDALYPRPSLEYASLPYTPAYYYVTALVSLVVGEGYLAGRLVSALALAGSLVLVGRMVFLETKSALSGLIAAGTFAALCEMSHYAGVMARVDSLCIFFVLLAAHIVRFHEGRAGVVVAILAGTAAILTKQTAILPVAALGAWMMLARFRKGLAFSLGVLAAVDLAHLVMGRASGGWSWFYLYSMPAAHPRIPALYAYFFKDLLLIGHGLGLALCGHALWPAKGDDPLRRKTILYYAALFVALGLSSLLPSVKMGGNVNNLIGISAGVSIGIGLACAKALERGRWQALAAGLLAAGFLLQHLHDPRPFLPSRAEESDMRKDLAAFRSMPVRIFAPCHGWLPEAAGRARSAFWSSMVDAFMTPQELETRLWDELKAAVLGKRFDAVVFYTGGRFEMDRFALRELEASYRPLEPGEAARRGWLEGATLEIYVPRD